MKINFLRNLIILISFSLTTFGCTKKVNENKSSLTFRLSKEPPTLDWNKSTDIESQIILWNIMSPLVELDFIEDQVIERPALFKNWVSMNNKYIDWKFCINSNVQWSDGVMLQTQHIVDSFERLLSPTTAAPNSYLFYDIKNAQEYNTGKIKNFNLVGISFDKECINFKLSKPISFFPKLLALVNVFPIRKDIINTKNFSWTDPNYFVGLGPYSIKSYIHGEKITLKKNSLYYKNSPIMNEIEFLVLPDSFTALNLYDTKKIDIMGDIPLELVNKFNDRNDFKKVNDLAIEYLAFNILEKPYDNIAIRKALNLAINNVEITNVLNSNFKSNANFLPRGIFGYDDNRVDLFDPEEAKKLWKKVNGPRKIKATYYSDENQKRLMVNIQSQLKNNLNIDVELLNMEWKTYLGKVNSEPPGFYRLGWLAILPDPSLFLGLYHSKSHFNTSNWQNSKYDQTVEKVKFSNNKTRRKIISEAQKILIDDYQVVIPLYSGQRFYLINPKVKNYKLSPLNNSNFSQVSKQ